MTTHNTNDEARDPNRAVDQPRSPGSGRGADSALNALIKRRVPPPEPPPASEETPPA